MTLTILDPRTGNRVAISVPHKPERERARRRVLCELDRLADYYRQTATNSSARGSAS